MYTLKFICLQMYKEGIYSDPECSSVKLDHLLLLVGYGSEDGKDYWLCKNSWGKCYVYFYRNPITMFIIAWCVVYKYKI